MVTHSVARAGVYSSGIPLEEAHTWRRMVARFKRLGSYESRVRAIERAAGLNREREEDNLRIS